MVTLDSVSFAYKDQPVINKLNLEIADKETTVLIGPSGCGKSTILRLVNGLLRPSKGSVLIDHEVVSDINLRSLRLRMGYVIQEGGLFPNMTAKQNITLMARRLKWDSAHIYERITALSELTHFSSKYLERYPSQLSGGQQQRVSLMRALMLDPELLLLDEPFGALDPLIRADLHESMIEIFRRLHKTVLMVTHDLNEAAYLGETIVLLKDGRIIQKGSIDDLIKKPADSFVTSFVRAQRSHIPGSSE